MKEKNLRFSLLIFMNMLMLLSMSSLFSDIVDLEENPQDFILETKKINIPGYPDAFNPSIVRWRGSLLMCFRIRDPQTSATNQIGFVWLNEKFDPISKPQVLKVQMSNPPPKSMAQDPRLLIIGNKLMMVYDDKLQNIAKPVYRMLVAKVLFDGVRFSIRNPEMFVSFDGENINRIEKNWVGFEYHGRLLFAYSQVPHVIFNPLLGTGLCETIATTKANIDWKWGELRGGSPALIDGDQYLGVFHSVLNMASVQSGGKKMDHYFMGAYTFSSQPPFALTKVSPEPIVGKGFYSGPAHNTWKPLRVVFPGGILFDDKHVWVAYGRQDHEIWIVKLDKQGLLNSLEPVISAE